MNKKIIFLATVATLWFSQVINAQDEPSQKTTEDSTNEVEEDVPESNDQELEKFARSLFQRTEMDTVVKYRKKVFPFVNFGLGNVATDGNFNNSPFGYLRSTSWEWGVMVRRPFNERSNLLGIRYGLSFSYNSLTPNGNNVFVLNGNQTGLDEFPVPLRRGRSYFRNSYFNIPFALDFDFSTKTYNSEKKKFEHRNGINFGVGGYVGVNINSKHFISYRDENDYKQSITEHGRWNVNDFNYGLMAYIGYWNLRIIAKYDLQPVFKNNPQDQNYWTLGLQYEFR